MHIRKIGGKWYALEGSKSTLLPPDMAAKLEKGEFKFADYVSDAKPLGQALRERAEKPEQITEGAWKRASELIKEHPELEGEIRQAKLEFAKGKYIPLLELVERFGK